MLVSLSLRKNSAFLARGVLDCLGFRVIAFVDQPLLLEKFEKPIHRLHCIGMGLGGFKPHLFEKFRVIYYCVGKIAPAGEQFRAEIIDVLKRDRLRKSGDGKLLRLWQVPQNHLMLIKSTACIVEARFRL